MSLTKRMLLSVISIVLVFAILGCTPNTPVEVPPTDEATAPPTEVVDTVKYAHGTTVDSNGNFVFTYNGETYDSEFDRLMAEDGYVFGIEELDPGGLANGQTDDDLIGETLVGKGDAVADARLYIGGAEEHFLIVEIVFVPRFVVGLAHDDLVEPVSAYLQDLGGYGNTDDDGFLPLGDVLGGLGGALGDDRGGGLGVGTQVGVNASE